MFAQFLIPKTVIAVNGAGATLALGTAQGGLLQLTLGIEKVIEQQSVEVHLEGSVDGETWIEKPLAAFPQKFYVGNSVIVCDLAAHPEIAFVAVYDGDELAIETIPRIFDDPMVITNL